MSLKKAFHKTGRDSIDLFAQQDVIEILELLLQEKAIHSILSNEVYAIKSLTRITCFNCVQDNIVEDITQIIRIPVLKDVPTSLQKILAPEPLLAASAPFCYVCSEHCDSESKLSFAGLGKYLIFQLNRFRVVDGVTSKDCAPFYCSPSIEVVTEVEGEVFVKLNYNLHAIINHSGTLHTGH